MKRPHFPFCYNFAHFMLRLNNEAVCIAVALVLGGMFASHTLVAMDHGSMRLAPMAWYVRNLRVGLLAIRPQ